MRVLIATAALLLVAASSPAADKGEKEAGRENLELFESIVRGVPRLAAYGAICLQGAPDRAGLDKCYAENLKALDAMSGNAARQPWESVAVMTISSAKETLGDIMKENLKRFAKGDARKGK